MTEPFQPTEPGSDTPGTDARVVPVPAAREHAQEYAADAAADQPTAAVPPAPAAGTAHAPHGAHRSARRSRALAATGALVLTGVVGAVAGHAVWQPGTNLVAQTQPAVPSAGGSGSAAGGGTDSGGTAGTGGTDQGGGLPQSGTGASGPAASSAVTSAVVDINTTIDYGSAQAAGTGIVVSSNGEVLTNNHVVRGATSIQVTDIGDGKTYAATVVGYDVSHDVAVLQLQGASGLATASFGKSSDVAVGDAVVGVGNAGGVGGAPSAAAGSVTALNQSIVAADAGAGTSEPLAGLIQVDANIQAGDSGGPLVNASGQVIGIDTAGSAGNSAGNSAGTAGTQGFAIPIDQALSIAQQIVNGNASSTVHLGRDAFLGVQVSPSAGSSPAAGFSGQGSQSGSGVTVAGVVSGTAAQQAGLSAGDVIDSVDGQAITSPDVLSSVLAGHHPGDRVDLSWTSMDGTSHSATVQLSAGPTG